MGLCEVQLCSICFTSGWLVLGAPSAHGEPFAATKTDRNKQTKKVVKVYIQRAVLALFFSLPHVGGKGHSALASFPGSFLIEKEPGNEASAEYE